MKMRVKNEIKITLIWSIISPKIFIFSFSSAIMAFKHWIAYFDCFVVEAFKTGFKIWFYIIEVFVSKYNEIPFKTNLSTSLGMTSSSEAHQGMHIHCLSLPIIAVASQAPAEAPIFVSIWRMTSETWCWSPLCHKNGNKYDVNISLPWKRAGNTDDKLYYHKIKQIIK